MTPYEYQTQAINKIKAHFETEQRVLYQLPTGGGKTALFSFLAKEWHGKVLIVAHREELVNQTMATLRTIGLTCESVVASKKKLQHHSKVYVAMIQTLKNRLKTDSDFCKDVSLIVVDEAHLLMHEEIFEYYPNAKILGVTATPVVMKKVNFSKCPRCGKENEIPINCCNKEMIEYTRDFTLSEIYENIIIGKSISDLINDGDLVPEIVFATGSVNRKNLKVDSSGEYKNTDSEFLKEDAVHDVVLNYEKLAKGKKTIIFNSSAKVNAMVLDQFLQAGYENVKLFDSVNDNSGRANVLKWFKDTPDAILLNVNCFTTGFDEPTVENVMLNRATLSLSLYHQMVGRGGRKCDIIYKPNFTLIDLCGNVSEFGKWSDEVDWEVKFFGTDKKPEPKKEALDEVKQCNKCGIIYQKSEYVCPNCGGEQVSQFKESETFSEEIAAALEPIPTPNGHKIIEYCIKNGKDKNFAWIVLQNQIVDMFIYHNVTNGSFEQSFKNGKYEFSVRNLIKEPYQLIQNSELESGTMRTKIYLINKITEKLGKYYNV
ncbi:MAG: DEAD/DEAH box helicase family protein [Ferruginibacter sp.]|nr:DEAD/DEAH box helicase family protein [Ferruginibacter sp.]